VSLDEFFGCKYSSAWEKKILASSIQLSRLFYSAMKDNEDVSSAVSVLEYSTIINLRSLPALRRFT